MTLFLLIVKFYENIKTLDILELIDLDVFEDGEFNDENHTELYLGRLSVPHPFLATSWINWGEKLHQDRPSIKTSNRQSNTCEVYQITDFEWGASKYIWCETKQSQFLNNREKVQRPSGQFRGTIIVFMFVSQ